MHGVHRKTDRGGDRRHDGDVRMAIRNVVLDDQGRASFLELAAYRWVERREVDSPAPRVARLRRPEESSRCHISLSTDPLKTSRWLLPGLDPGPALPFP